ncbi:DUF1778 domain-containing protein [Acinetobacter sp. Marseille-Q1618]|uniref:type II toxin-antitoxin system TacA family antitoxin n=1 Tax=Acinetobacter sp. Marseille-Q1618 TaxID=2697502 RepID=UPI0015713649|nr:DUF1778 domain-containing protein [Acinetobacter sp. Marseille-Q1618]
MEIHLERDRIDLRVYASTKELAQRAAAASGCSSVTEYIVRLIHENAPQTLREQATIQLTNEQFDRFLKACNTQQSVPDRLKQTAQLLDKEGL